MIIVFYGSISERMHELCLLDKQTKLLWLPIDLTLVTQFLELTQEPCLFERCFEDVLQQARDLMAPLGKDMEARLTSVLLDSFEGSSHLSKVKPNIAVLPSNDTHVFLLRNLLRKHEQHFKAYSNPYKKERSTESMLGQGIPVHDREPLVSHANGLLVGMDWDTYEINQCLEFRKLGKLSFCLQESVIDFYRKRRMLNADIGLFQGLVSWKISGKKIGFITGNPRYEHLRKMENAATPLILINLNFTYGVEENHAKHWLESAIYACQELGAPLRVMQHPRNKTAIPQGIEVIQTSASNIHKVLASGTIVISRFSSLIHEAMCLNKQVVYYNPHKEVLGYDFEEAPGILEQAHSQDTLKQSIKRLMATTNAANRDIVLDRYLSRHCYCVDGKASQRVFEAIQTALQHQATITRLLPDLPFKLKWRNRIAMLKRKFIKWCET